MGAIQTFTAGITSYRAPRARVAVAYSTKDRLEQTRASIAPLLDDPEIDLHWFDGSATEAGRLLPAALCAGRPAVCAVHAGVTGGPDSAIMHALKTLRALDYDLVILIENDVVLAPGWLAALRESMARAQADGFTPGGATVRVYANRVLSFNGDYSLMLNSGAGFIALTPPAIDIVLAHYRTLDGAEFFRLFQSATGLDVSGTVEFEPARRLSVDWFFDLLLYLHGYVVTAPPTTFATTSDDTANAARAQVRHPDQHLPTVRARLTRPDQIQNIPYKSFRFQKSPLSERVLIGCHQLRIAVNPAAPGAPLVAGGAWRRLWLQGIGPFGLHGGGDITVTTYGIPTGLLLYGAAARSEVHLLAADGALKKAFALEPHTLADCPLETEVTGAPPPGRVILRVVTGQLCLVGLTTNACLLSAYANGQPSVDHLPL